MDQKTGWITAIAVIGVLLVGALVVLGVVVATRSDAEASKAGTDELAELQNKICELEGDVAQANADAAAARQEAAAQQQASTQAASGSSSSGSGSSGSSGTGNKAQIEALALAFAEGVDPTVDWDTGNTIIDGNWASVGVGSATRHDVQGCTLYYHKVGGIWTLVTYGTGLCPGDVPGAPDSIYQ